MRLLERQINVQLNLIYRHQIDLHATYNAHRKKTYRACSVCLQAEMSVVNISIGADYVAE